MQASDVVLFDFDFTLADSSSGVIECMHVAFDQLGLERPEPDAVRNTIGLTLPVAFRDLSGHDDPALAERFLGHFMTHADRVMVDRTTVYASVRPVATYLRERGFALGIVSTKYRYRIESILRRDGLDDLFGAIVGGEDIERHKPDPSGLLLAIEKLGARPDAATYVGDHPVDAHAARGAGVRFVATLTGTSPRDAFDGLPAHALIGQLSDLPGVLHEL